MLSLCSTVPFCLFLVIYCTLQSTAFTIGESKEATTFDIVWFHPLTRCKFRWINCEQAAVDLESVPVEWNGDIYMSGLEQGYEGRLWRYSVGRNSWDELQLPFHDKRKYALTTYQSKLLLISKGLGRTSRGVVWEFDNNESTFKQSGIAPVPNLNEAAHISAASEGEYLVVAHKAGSGDMFSVKLYDGNIWIIRTGQLSLNYIISYINIYVIVHHHTLFVYEHVDRKFIANIYKASLNSFMSTSQFFFWTHPKQTSPVPLGRHSNLGIFGGYLVVVAADFQHIRILGYSIMNEDWIYLDKSNYGFFPAPRIIVLSQGTLLVIGGSRQPGILKEISGISKFDILEIQPEVITYNPDELLTVAAITNLERGVAKIPVLTTLQPKLGELKKAVGFKLLNTEEHNEDFGYEPSLTIKYINSWVHDDNCITPTWRNFLRIIKDISPELRQLSHQVELYFAGKAAVSSNILVDSSSSRSVVIKNASNSVDLVKHFSEKGTTPGGKEHKSESSSDGKSKISDVQIKTQLKRSVKSHVTNQNTHTNRSFSSNDEDVSNVRSQKSATIGESVNDVREQHHMMKDESIPVNNKQSREHDSTSKSAPNVMNSIRKHNKDIDKSLISDEGRTHENHNGIFTKELIQVALLIVLALLAVFGTLQMRRVQVDGGIILDQDFSLRHCAPTLHELDLIEANGKRVRVISATAGKWDKLATRLFLEGYDIERIERDCFYRPESSCRKVFTEWLEGKYRKPVTWDTVIKALQEASFSKVVGDLTFVLHSQSDPYNPQSCDH